MTAVCRFATFEDWPKLREFYRSIYRHGHPLHNAGCWRWQYGDPQHGQAAIVIECVETYR